MILLNSKISINILRPSFYVLLLLMIHSISKPLNAQTFPYAPGDVPACMTTDQLKLSTGINWIANAAYNMNEADRFWQLISGPNVSQARCATVWAQWHPAGGWVGLNCNNNIDHGSRVISGVDSDYPSPNTTQTVCMGNNTYIFKRRFFVNSTTPIIANLSLNADVDDGLHQIKINGNILFGSNAPCINDNTSNPCDGWALNWNWNNISLQPGENKLEIFVENRSVGSSTMALNVDATLSSITAANVFVKNDYYIPNTEPGTGCYTLNSALYPPYPTYTQTCVTLPSNTGQIIVSNYNPTFTYSVSPSISMTGANFNAVVGSIYTITASNALGCGVTATATLNASALLNVSLSTNSICLPPPPNSSVVVPITITGGTAPFTYLVSPNLLPPVTNNNLVVNLAGTYTLTATDINNCVSTTFIQAGNTFDLTLNIPTPCVGKILTAQVTPALPNITYALNGGTPQAGNTFVINTAGIYTVTATDPWGCTSVSTIQVFDNPQLQVVSDGVPCYPTFTVLNNSGAALLSSTWNDPFNLVSWVPSPPLLPTQFSPGAYQNPLPPAIIYTVTAVDVNGCTNTITVNYDPNPFCCQFQFQQIPADPLTYFSDKPPYNNATASAIIAAYGNSTITNANLIAFDGDIIIDQDITFSSCPQMRCTFDTRFIVQPGVTLTFINCDVSAYCDGMWRGVFADEPNMKVIAYSSSFADMNDGFVMDHGARIECKDNTFTNNFTSLQLLNSPNGYNSGNGTCIIHNNVFTSNGIALLFPHTTQIRPESGIRVELCKEVQIGGLLSGEGNHFEKLFNGVRILNGPFTQNESYYLYNNTFFDIRRVPTVSSAVMLQKYAAWAITDHRGAAIYSIPSNFNNPTPAHRLIVDASSETVNFDLCDRAISAHVTSATVKSQTVARCLMGFLFPRCNTQKFTIQNNAIGGNSSNPEEATVLGMRFVGNALNSTLLNNNISLTDLASVWWTGTLYPIGIDIEYVTIDPNNGFYIEDSYITLNNASSIGIGLRNCSKMTDVYQNIIINYSNGLNGNSLVHSGGIFLQNCVGTRIRGNQSTGTVNLLSNPNAYDGICLSASPDCLIECNEAAYTRRGMRVYSNCFTASNNVRGNIFSNHGYALEFEDNGTYGTLGDIGTSTEDCMNVFFNSALLSAGVFGIYRNVSIPFFSDRIYTTNYSNSYSCSNQINCDDRYIVTPNFNAIPFDCPQTIYYMLNPNIFSTISLQKAIEIVTDSSLTYQLGEAVSWMEKQRLFNALSGPDSILLSNSVLAQFYINQQMSYSDELLGVNKLINQLNDSTIYSDSNLYNQKLNQIEELNDLISGANNLELNEKMINTYIIQTMKNGTDSLNTTDSIWIAQLAYSCPFVNGYGVYKARTLLKLIGSFDNPNDKNLCYASGMYKMNNDGNEPIINLSNQELELIKVYPNPFNDIVKIEYNFNTNEDVAIIVYDIVGNFVLSDKLDYKYKIKTLNLSQQAPGIYFYKVSTPNGKNYTGKLIKE